MDRSLAAFPPTRYQGSKRKLLPFLAQVLGELPGERALDAFGGTAAVSWLLRAQGRRVTYNDLLAACAEGARALLGGPGPPLGEEAVLALLRPQPGRRYDDLIAREYAGIYFTPAENAELDLLAQNVSTLADPGQRSRVWWAVAQACLIKRPYNLFHRANLGLRLASVPRSFGNKVSWERPFAELLPTFVRQAERAAALGEGLPPVTVRCGDVATLTGQYDLIYLDPPYLPDRGGGVDYGDFYHFLEGLLDYQGWAGRIDHHRRHRPYRTAPSPWGDRRLVPGLLSAVVERFAGATLVLSYRSDGVPDPEQIVAALRRVRSRVTVHDAGEYRYALSTRRHSRELVFVGR